MKYLSSLLFICFTAVCYAQGPELISQKMGGGTIVGSVTVKGTDQAPVPFAYVKVKGTGRVVNANGLGNYEISSIAPGVYDLEFSFVGFETLVVSDVNVSPQETVTVNAILHQNIEALNAVVVKVNKNRESVEALLFDQKQAHVMIEAIGAQELSAKGLSNVAEGVKQITGVTQQKSKGIVVRGLGERYNYLTVNGLPIITGNPDKKIIPLDKFSTNLVRNINVYKTFQPNLSGDFAGAAFNIVTKDIPRKPVTHIKIGVGGNTQTTFQPFKIDAEGSTEYLGISGAQRHLPAAYDKTLIELGHSSTPEASKHLFATGFDVKEIQAPISTSLEITHGTTHHLEGDKSLGYYIGFGFKNKYKTKPNVKFKSLNTQGGYNANYEDVQDYTLSTEKSLLLAAQYKNGEAFTLKFNNIFIKSTSNFTREQFGYNAEANDDFFARLSRFRNIMINQSQLLGQWQLANNNRHHMKFGASYGVGTYKEPDRKMLYAEGRGADARLYIANSSEPNRHYADLDIHNINGYVEYTLGLGAATTADEFAQHLHLGVEANHLAYDYFNRVIRLNINPAAFPAGMSSVKDIPLNTNTPDNYIQQGFIQGWLNYKDGSDASKFSKINQLALAAYASYDFHIDKWSVVLGLRGEFFKRLIKYRKPTTGVYQDFLEVENDDNYRVMPSLNVKYQLTENANLRLAASVTSTRPRVREILPIRYLKGPFDLVTGNPELQNSTNYNIDVKYEWFPNDGGLLSLTGFGKYIDAPIETVIAPVAGGSSISFANTEKAIIYGAELEYRTNLGQLFNQDQLKPWAVGLNATYLFSEVTIDKTEETQRFLTNDKRQLQGASPFIINANLSYNTSFNENWDSRFTLTYNVFGERIYRVGGSKLDDVYQQPYNRLNFIWKNTLGDFTINLEVENLLNDMFELQQTPTGTADAHPISVAAHQYGIDFGLSVGYTF